MKVLSLKNTGGPEVFQILEIPKPALAPNDVLIDLKATGLNWSEVMIRKGDWPLTLDKGFVPGAEGAGIVDEVGNAVSTVRPGDRVAVLDFKAYSDPGHGTYASHIVVNEQNVLQIPSHLDFVQAASLPVALLTAYDALIRYAPLPESGNMIVTACTGAVGIAALQVGRMKGLRVVGTTRDEKKAPLIRDLGCDVVIGDNPADTCGQIKEILGESAVDYVFDPVQGQLAEGLLSLMAENGTYVGYGNLAGSSFVVPAGFLFNQLGIHGYVVLKNLGDPNDMQSVWSEIYPLLEEKLITIPVAKTFPFPEAGAGQAAMETHRHFGKIVMTQ